MNVSLNINNYYIVKSNLKSYLHIIKFNKYNKIYFKLNM